LDLSVIIVNYNVKYFLEQCLCSVQKAIGRVSSMEVEVFVIDNHSTDGSLEYLQPKFPWAHFVANEVNQGFAKANNQGLSRSAGRYILFLNPDTIMAEDCFEKVILSLDTHPDVGASGVRMIDGAGRYLKESKRGFPSPWNSFCKMTGLTSLFPHSGFFAGYYLGHLKENNESTVATLSGAFMIVRKEVLGKTGGFDEQYFMYAEDIDLSHRIRLAGYLNYYFPKTTIIHFKGESTQRDLRYTKLFYKAMIQFNRTYFRQGGKAFIGILMEAGIRFRSAIAFLMQLFKIKHSNTKHLDLPIYLSGDSHTVTRIKPILLQLRKNIVENREQAQEIIFCEGEACSFGEIIESVQQPEESARYQFHAAGSQCIVGSETKEKMGGVIFSADF
jgi:N-acetylglucosaminyl-diphospho-decaprenol L-rhamnosyltransferase